MDFSTCSSAAEVANLCLSTTPRDPCATASHADFAALKAVTKRYQFHCVYFAILRRLSTACANKTASLYLTTTASRLFSRRMFLMVHAAECLFTEEQLISLSFTGPWVHTYIRGEHRDVLKLLVPVLPCVSFPFSSDGPMTPEQVCEAVSTLLSVVADAKRACRKKSPVLGERLVAKGWNLLLRTTRKLSVSSSGGVPSSCVSDLQDASHTLQALMSPRKDADDQLLLLEHLSEFDRLLGHATTRPLDLWDDRAWDAVSDAIPELIETLGDDKFYNPHLLFLRKSCGSGCPEYPFPDHIEEMFEDRRPVLTTVATAHFKQKAQASSEERRVGQKSPVAENRDIFNCKHQCIAVYFSFVWAEPHTKNRLLL